ncbi:hepatitis A virus cellular receptor 1 isoform 2-T2 [Aulostomus maculatus]
MLPLLRLHVVACIVILLAPACAFSVTAETVVVVAGRRAVLPCRLEMWKRRRLEVCWGRGQPSLFSCHNTVINTSGKLIIYRSSYRYSVSSLGSGGVSSLSIAKSRQSDSGFYHCRVQLPGLFNDQTYTVHLIVIEPRPVVSYSSAAPQTMTSHSRADLTKETGSGMTAEDVTVPVVARAQSPAQQQVNSLETFIGHTLRSSFIIFIPAVLLSAGYRIWRSNQRAATGSRLNQSEEEEETVESPSI